MSAKKMNKKKVKTQDEILKEIIERSGHDFHLRVSSLLQKTGWEVKNSQHYSDPVTKLNREIDIVAVKEFESGGKYNTKIYLYIECKYISHETMVWTTERNEGKTISLIQKNHAQNKFYDANLDKKHHYFKNARIAKVHESENKKQIFEKAINQVLNGFIYFDDLVQPREKSVSLAYPVIAVNSFNKVFERINIKSDEKKQYRKINDNFQYEIDYINNTVPEYYLIDIVCFDKLGEFFKEIEEIDLEILHQHLRREWSEQAFKTKMRKIQKNPAR